MSGKGYHVLFLGVLVNLNINKGVFGDEQNEESEAHYEYTQIFRSVPALFEYLFDALEERPEILEKNDVTIFGRNVHGLDTDECEISENDRNIKKRHVDWDSPTLQDFNYLDKRDAKEVTETTVAYEYGNSNEVMVGLDDPEGYKEISRRFTINDDIIRTKKEIPKKENRINSRKKINVISKTIDDANTKSKDHGDTFLGFENLFGLDLKPEDIEERILTAEKLLEEHNNKKE